MILKKSLKRGQSILEYFILFSVMVTLSVLGICSAFPQLKDTIFGSDTQDGYFQAAVGNILK